MAKMSSREFNRDVSAAKREASRAPLTITDRGEPAYVLVSIADYRRMNGEGKALVNRLSMDDDFEFEFEPIHVDLKAPEL